MLELNPTFLADSFLSTYSSFLLWEYEHLKIGALASQSCYEEMNEPVEGTYDKGSAGVYSHQYFIGEIRKRELIFIKNITQELLSSMQCLYHLV